MDLLFMELFLDLKNWLVAYKLLQVYSHFGEREICCQNDAMVPWGRQVWHELWSFKLGCSNSRNTNS